MLFPLFIGMALSFILVIVVGFLAFLGFIVKLAGQPLTVLDPGEESWSALHVETRPAQETRAVADTPHLFSGRREP